MNFLIMKNNVKIETEYCAIYKSSDGTVCCNKVRNFKKSMINKPLWIEPTYNSSDYTDLIIAETSDDYYDRGWRKVSEVIKTQKIIKITKVY